jgi:hypothetical protein
MRTYTIHQHHLKKSPSAGPAHHIAPHGASGRSRPPPKSSKPRSRRTYWCAANARNPPRLHLQPSRLTRFSPSPSSCYNPISITMSSNSNFPSPYRKALLRDRPAPAHTGDHYNPRSRLACHSLALFLTAPQPPPTAQDEGTALTRTPYSVCPRRPLVYH